MFRLGASSLLVVLLAAFALAGFARAESAPWPVYGQNISHTGTSPHPVPEQPHVLWRFSTGAGIESNPIIAADGTVYVGSSDGALYALNPDGTLRWRFEAQGGVMTPALLPDGGLVVGSLDDHLYALAPDGALRWRFATGGNIEGAPTVDPKGIIYFGSGDGSLYSLNPDGSLRWRYATGGPVYGSPALADKRVIVGSFDKKLHVVDSAKGEAIWVFETRDSSPYGIYASPAVDRHGRIHVGNVDRRFYVVNPDGSVRWEKKYGSPIITSALPLDDGVILATGKALLRHGEPPEGSTGTDSASPPKGVGWIFLAPDTLASSPALGANGLVLVGCDDGHLYALNLADGKMRWKLKLDGRVASSPSIGVGGRIYVGTDAGTLVAIGEAPPAVTESPADTPETADKPETVDPPATPHTDPPAAD